MGLLRNLAKKVVGAAKAAKEEANHPGRPPAHKVDGNPFHQDDPPPKAPGVPAAARSAAPANPSPPPPAAPLSHAAEDLAAGQTASGQVGVKANQDRTGRPWYLDGTQEGWDDTDPT